MKKYLSLLLIAAMLLCLAACAPVTPANTDNNNAPEKTITVTVVHADGTSKDFTYTTTEEFLGPVLLSEGLAKGENGDYGLYIKEVDGETADYSVNKRFWSLYIGEEQALTGADAVAVTDGAVYKLVNTAG